MPCEVYRKSCLNKKAYAKGKVDIYRKKQSSQKMYSVCIKVQVWRTSYGGKILEFLQKSIFTTSFKAIFTNLTLILVIDILLPQDID